MHNLQHSDMLWPNDEVECDPRPHSQKSLWDMHFPDYLTEKESEQFCWTWISWVQIQNKPLNKAHAAYSGKVSYVHSENNMAHARTMYVMA
jgi:hypothetical protein